MNKLHPAWWAFCAVLFCLACQPPIAPDVKPSDITKAQREQLGQRVAISMAIDKDQYPVLHDMPPYDTTVYAYLQQLYNQATSTIRLDRQSPAEDRWDYDRPWRVIVLDKAEQNAFAIPGGYFYITTGLLKMLEHEYQLFYIMCFEAILVNDKFLLDRLINEFSTTTIFKIANDSPAPQGTTPGSIAEMIDQLEFDPESVRHIDERTAELICDISVMDRMGILPLLLQDDGMLQWLQTRPSYGGRISYVLEGLSNPGDCGSFRSNGSYQQMVLDRL